MKITIDGILLEVKENLTVLEAALSNGVYIPNLCYHPNLPAIGACRLCIVTIEGTKGFPASCTTKVKDGMIIQTNTPRIRELRKDIMGLILSEHPVEIYSESQLEKVAQWVGSNSLFPGFKPVIKDISLVLDEPLFNRDLKRCILCGRCVRICQDIRGIGAIDLAYRGLDTVVSTGHHSSLKDSGCKFCRACVEVCPSGALVDKLEYKENRQEKLLPCNSSCPAGIDVARYVRLIAEGRFQDSLEVIRERVPFPHVLGCVCTHPCEEACFRGEVTEPIAIRALKRFVAQLDTGRWRSKIKVVKDSGKKVAIIGSGPCGLTAAWFLRKRGHSVTVFESHSQAGGMMRTAIPKYRLPREILDKEIDDIISIGVHLELNTKVESLSDLFEQGFDAIFVAIGLPLGAKGGIPGSENRKVLDGISVLHDINCSGRADISGDVAIIGGGNVAIDVARSVLRTGAKSATVIYRRTEQEMPALKEEVQEALEEGVRIKFLSAPIGMCDLGESLKLECISISLGEPDFSGRKAPLPVKGSEFSLEFNRIVMAIGQNADVPKSFGFDLNKKGLIVVDKQDLCCSMAGVFAGGDVVSGPASVIEAIQAGREAAASIDRYLGGSGNIEQSYIPQEEDPVYLGRENGFAYKKRIDINAVSADKRIKSFIQTEHGLSEKAALEESGRCLRCQLRLKISQAPLPLSKNPE
ncbi:MAG TPA: FAD-dependent oxidoreductase [Candidatus Omnitrophica bacterium]|nr:FAD-dependent oxidoreductase [Candidatus Omnitrophota bacterium]